MSELAVEALPPEGAQVYEKGVDVPVTIADAVPLAPPKQETLVEDILVV